LYLALFDTVQWIDEVAQCCVNQTAFCRRLEGDFNASMCTLQAEWTRPVASRSSLFTTAVISGISGAGVFVIAVVMLFVYYQKRSRRIAASQESGTLAEQIELGMVHNPLFSDDRDFENEDANYFDVADLVETYLSIDDNQEPTTEEQQMQDWLAAFISPADVRVPLCDVMGISPYHVLGCSAAYCR
jgi:hypothetical protein